MSLDEALANYKAAHKGPKCSVCVLLLQLSDKEKDALRVALDDRSRYTGPGISSILKSEGYDIGPAAIGRHRRGECSK